MACRLYYDGICDGGKCGDCLTGDKLAPVIEWERAKPVIAGFIIFTMALLVAAVALYFLA